MAVAAMLNAKKEDILCVRGNCDSEIDQVVLEFPMMAECVILSVGKKMIFATHGHRFNTKTPPPLHEGDILLHGHTHIPVLEDRGAYILANPGSVTLPKQNSARGYLLLEDGSMIYKTLEGVSEKSLQL